MEYPDRGDYIGDGIENSVDLDEPKVHLWLIKSHRIFNTISTIF
jgi:hypothetical protein